MTGRCRLSHRFLDRHFLSLPSPHHSTAAQSPKRYEGRYEKKGLDDISAVAGTLGSNLFAAASALASHKGRQSRCYRTIQRRDVSGERMTCDRLHSHRAISLRRDRASEECCSTLP